ncbi:MAG: c-type cytochrome biogenesis protein CcsB [Gammaproteobacteria bacterium]|nr:c-type cytochrome biogenesis protein CcsB [Gammaproteobacteria bacterium]MCW8840242.1 c-type cytochrome biogenesis protein CcsB [Gammaproteobacteria bacterium]MCW8928262.1 c-type cytochrome biogenesis protein CcsB [Gammaproteobacteria bacterium]MCW8959890.1 c-type cytochrome biogenesis protein CcsB [Gammaproteobacteria bacterium]MCW8972371.1 c-type cytochrome biogenesis protein CcsB [Gammaproteobacteria bacterium]
MSATQEYLQNEFDKPSLFKRLGAYDWLWALLVLIGSGVAYSEYSSLMDSYEVGILFGSAIGLIIFGWYWKPMRHFSLVVAVLSLAAIGLYGDELTRSETNFFLKYLIASQSAIMWMNALFVMATLAYWFALAIGSEFSGKVGTALTWTASVMGTVGLMVRWRESYLISHDVGHIPVSNLYEVFIMFAVITALLYLHYERRYNNRAMGAFVLTVISAAVGFLLWYTFERGAHEIQPLVPALQSYWMKIHVPANFVGYGAFALAAMLGIAYLLLERFPGGKLAARMPSLEQLDDIMYKAIALGFAFFTVATVLGAMWAAEAWGGYWSWDPKETWALIVWLNYAAWLHLRLTKGWRGKPLAWWAIVGLFVTLFAFLGVNMFLSGLHSYGQL